MVDESRRKLLKGLAGLIGAAILGTSIFKYGINNSSHQNFLNNLNSPYQNFSNNSNENNNLYQNFPSNLNNLQYIFWNVPWGPDNGTYKKLDPYFQSNSPITEGVIVAFDNNYNHSLDQILHLYKNNINKKPIYINLFVTANANTNRDALTDLSPYDGNIKNFLKYLSNNTNGGENIVIGFSELDKAPIEQLAYYYSLMKQYLPNAKLFYYVDMGNSTRIEDLYRYLLNEYHIKLDMIGLEVYGTYNYNNGNISMSDNYSEGTISMTELMINPIMKYKQFADQNNIKFFIGELGFRDGDLKGYKDSSGTGYWNSPSEQGYQATIEYYENIIKQLHEMGIDIIGIYNWNGYNGDPFGLWNNPYVNNLINYMINNSNNE